MKKSVFILICFISAFVLTGCGTSYYVPNRPYGYSANFTKTYTDKSVYRPNHYRNFVHENSTYLNDNSRVSMQANSSGKRFSTDGRGDDVFLVKSYLDAHTETEKPVYHTTYTTSYNDNGEVTTTYTTDYVGTKKEEQYWAEVRKEAKKSYQESRKKKKMRVKEMDE